MATKAIKLEVVKAPEGEGFVFQARQTSGEGKGKTAWRSECIWATKESAGLGAVKHFDYSEKGKGRIATVEERGFKVTRDAVIKKAMAYHGQLIRRSV